MGAQRASNIATITAAIPNLAADIICGKASMFYQKPYSNIIVRSKRTHFKIKGNVSNGR